MAIEYKEGDFVPGKGTLLPDGSYDASSLNPEADTTATPVNTPAAGTSGVAGSTPPPQVVSSEDAAITKQLADEKAAQEAKNKATQDQAQAKIDAERTAGEAKITSAREAANYLGYGTSLSIINKIETQVKSNIKDIELVRDNAITSGNLAVAKAADDMILKQVEMKNTATQNAFLNSIKQSELLLKARELQLKEIELGQGLGGNITEIDKAPAWLQATAGNIAGFKYIDMGKLTTKQIPAAQIISNSTGIPLLTKQQTQVLQQNTTDANRAISLLNSITKLSDKLITATTPGGVLSQYANKKLGALSRLDPDAKTYLDSVSAFSSLLTRAAGEKGVLTDQDVQRIIKALPNLGDTVASASMKEKQLRTLFESGITAQISTLSGIPIQDVKLDLGTASGASEPSSVTTLYDPKTKKTKKFTGLSAEEIKDAIAQGFQQIP